MIRRRLTHKVTLKSERPVIAEYRVRAREQAQALKEEIWKKLWLRVKSTLN